MGLSDDACVWVMQKLKLEWFVLKGLYAYFIVLDIWYCVVLTGVSIIVFQHSYHSITDRQKTTSFKIESVVYY